MLEGAGRAEGGWIVGKMEVRADGGGEVVVREGVSGLRGEEGETIDSGKGGDLA